MARIDVPTLQCDRCKATTQDGLEMVAFVKIERPHMSGTDRWDLCPTCSAAFRRFIIKDDE